MRDLACTLVQGFSSHERRYRYADHLTTSDSGSYIREILSHGMCHAVVAEVGKAHLLSTSASAALDTVSSVYTPQCMPDNQMLHGAIIMLRPCLDIRDDVPLAAMQHPL